MIESDCNAACNERPDVQPSGQRPSTGDFDRERLRTHAKMPHPDYPDRWSDGTVRAGHPGPALRHGGRSALLAAGALPSQADALAALQAREAAVVTDLGGEDVISALAAGQVQRHVKLELVEATLWNNLQTHGTLTGKGNTRAAALLWLQVVDRIQKSASALGLERRSRPVNPIDAVRRAVEEANQR